jgi:biotin carboxyl carrier protein
VAAFIPDTIMKVFVKEKDKVKKGDAMVVLQAMKMNNHILAPITGVIKKIHVKQTDNVAKNQILVEFR